MSFEIEEDSREKTYIIPQADSSTLMYPPFKISGRPPRVMKERVRLRDIKGSLRDNQLFDRFFRPKVVNKKIRKIWEWIANQQRSRRSFGSISLTKISNHEYYVYEGVRRVSALKHLGWREIDVLVADFTHLKTGRPPVYSNKKNYKKFKKRPIKRYKMVQIFAPKINKPSEIKKEEEIE